MISGIHIQGMPLIICYQYIKIYMNKLYSQKKVPHKDVERRSN